MGRLALDPRLGAPDDVYARLIEAYRDLDEVESRKLSAKMILLLANHIGDAEVFEEALAIAKDSAAKT